MKVSTKGRYALRIMMDLAMNCDGTYISLKDISHHQGVSDKYSEQIINQLNKAGFVKSARGSKGGYMLANKPADYTVGMILRLLEGSLSPVACLDEGATSCDRVSSCVALDVWKELKDAIDNVVDNITLEDLVKKQKEKIGSDYVI